MMIFLIILFLSAGRAGAEEVAIENSFKHSFTPHSTVSARTGEWGSVALQRTPGTNRKTSALMSSLTAVVIPRLEIGTALLLHTSPYHNSNFNVKVNFFRSDLMNWALSYSNILWRPPYYDTGTSIIYEKLKIESLSLVTNIQPEGSLWSYGVSTTFSSTYVEVEGLPFKFTEEAQPEYNLDISYEWSGREDITLGLGMLRDQGLTAFEKTRFGFGVSYALYRPQKLFSKPTVGLHYTPDVGSFLWSFATTFY
ncbi:hypothetical protein [Bdellovibrio sp. HCB337]|uniref:hypothetical protein n=1 Tax=Bdellovibrio sp. HCB337 TaxID=3394358 RepID=UPI0039A48DA3